MSTIHEIPREVIGKVSMAGKKYQHVKFFTDRARRAMVTYLENKNRNANYRNASDITVCQAVIHNWAIELTEKTLGRKFTGAPRLVKRFK